MRALLDTHTFFWFIDDSPRLSAHAKSLIADGTNEILLSTASVWEMAIKISLGKLSVSGPLITYIEQQLHTNNIELLNISLQHIGALETLPFYHRDPFDRLLIAQAYSEGIPLVSAEAVLDAYAIHRLW